MEQVNYTTIHHDVRKQLGLSMNEYALADLIYHLSNNPQGDVIGWCYASKPRLGIMLDLSEQSIHTILHKLLNLKIIEKHPTTKHLRTTAKWYNMVIVKKLDTKESLATLKEVEKTTKETLVQTTKESLANNNIYKTKLKIKEKQEKENKAPPFVPDKSGTTFSKFSKDYIELFNKLFQSNYQVTRGRDEKIRLRLKTYTPEKLAEALVSLSRSSWHRGKNDRNWVADPDFLIRNDEMIDKWLNNQMAAAKVSGMPRFAIASSVKERLAQSG